MATAYTDVQKFPFFVSQQITPCKPALWNATFKIGTYPHRTSSVELPEYQISEPRVR